ncbi:MAG: DUF3137 domain-containing protein [Litorimonas sp.]
MHDFRTRHAELKGFSEFYDNELRPWLVERDADRRAAVRRAMAVGLVVGAVVAAIATYLALRTEETGVAVAFYGVALLLPFGIFALMTQGVRSATKARIVSSIVGYVGWQFTEDVTSYDLSPYRDLFLLTDRIDKQTFEDRLDGEAHGARFHAVEAHLEKITRDSRGRRRDVTVFRGQLMQIDFPTQTFGRTVVLRDKGWFNAKKKSDMKRIGLADPVFEKLFEAYGTDQVESRVVLHPAFMQRMVDLETALQGKALRFGFDSRSLFIAVETPDQFEAGSMLSPLDDPKRTQKILDEIGAVFDVVDMLLGRNAVRPGPV